MTSLRFVNKALPNLILAIVLMIAGFAIGYLKYGSGTKSGIFKRISDSNTYVVNSHFVNGEKSGEYMTFKVEYPSKYVATSSEMVTPYISQGGGASPNLIFSTNQISNIDDFQKILKSGETCVVIQSTIGWTTFEDWSNSSWLASTSVEILGTSTKKIGKFSVHTRKIINNDNGLEALDALIQLPEDVGYYFRSCNLESAKDLETMLKTFDTTGSFYDRSR